MNQSSIDTPIGASYEKTTSEKPEAEDSLDKTAILSAALTEPDTRVHKDLLGHALGNDSQKDKKSPYFEFLKAVVALFFQPYSENLPEMQALKSQAAAIERSLIGESAVDAREAPDLSFEELVGQLTLAGKQATPNDQILTLLGRVDISALSDQQIMILGREVNRICKTASGFVFSIYDTASRAEKRLCIAIQLHTFGHTILPERRRLDAYDENGVMRPEFVKKWAVRGFDTPNGRFSHDPTRAKELGEPPDYVPSAMVNNFGHYVYALHGCYEGSGVYSTFPLNHLQDFLGGDHETAQLNACKYDLGFFLYGSECWRRSATLDEAVDRALPVIAASINRRAGAGTIQTTGTRKDQVTSLQKYFQMMRFSRKDPDGNFDIQDLDTLKRLLHLNFPTINGGYSRTEQAAGSQINWRGGDIRDYSVTLVSADGSRMQQHRLGLHPGDDWHGVDSNGMPIAWEGGLWRREDLHRLEVLENDEASESV